ncbi:MAG: KpsF/GutQ family sugar-phosphate isomerase [Pseudomonadota bacterium]|nr:KpsF/GutQ family sugar-phosphate isomerase [Pseudomonadota bacterium]
MQHLAEVEVIGLGASVFFKQADSLNQIGSQLGTDFFVAVQTILNTRGRVILSGMGKSGHIAGKIAATFASTGTPSFFVHPAEAFHGDLGMITADDAVILLSNSGKTEEVTRLLPYLQEIGVPIIAICAERNSVLGQAATVVLEVAVEREVCPNNLAPTTSTTATLAMGDALAVALIKLRQFEPKDFARFHPGGSLGRMLLTRVQDVMHRHVPIVNSDATFADLVSIMTQGRLGLAIVVDAACTAIGIVTDGDIRRSFEQYSDQVFQKMTHELMSSPPISVSMCSKLEAARQVMQQHQISALVAVDTHGHVAGVLNLHDVS